MSFWNLKKKTGNKLRPMHSSWKIPFNAKRPFKDSDGDKVIDIFDCQPKNRRKQGTGLKLVRVKYGKKDTPSDMKEYQIEGHGPVGTIKEYKEHFPNEEFEIEDKE